MDRKVRQRISILEFYEPCWISESACTFAEAPRMTASKSLWLFVLSSARLHYRIMTHKNKLEFSDGNNSARGWPKSKHFSALNKFPCMSHCLHNVSWIIFSISLNKWVGECEFISGHRLKAPSQIKLTSFCCANEMLIRLNIWSLGLSVCQWNALCTSSMRLKMSRGPIVMKWFKCSIMELHLTLSDDFVVMRDSNRQLPIKTFHQLFLFSSPFRYKSGYGYSSRFIAEWHGVYEQIQHFLLISVRRRVCELSLYAASHRGKTNN